MRNTSSLQHLGFFIRSGPISDVLAVTTSGRYRDVCMASRAVVRKLFGHVDVSDESDDDDRIGERLPAPPKLWLETKDHRSI